MKAPPELPELLSVLRAHEQDLRARGVERLVLFGSAVRGEAGDASDVDIAFHPGPRFSSGGFDHFGKLDALRDHLADLLRCNVDLVEEPVSKERLRQVIAREGVRAF